MSTFDPAQHPRGNQSTGHAGQFATKTHSGADVDLGQQQSDLEYGADYDFGKPIDPDFELELASRFLNDPPELFSTSYHALYMNREDWGPGLAFLPADVDAADATFNDFIISAGGGRGAFVDATRQPISLNERSDQRYRFVGPIDDSPVVRQRAEIWFCNGWLGEVIHDFEENDKAIFADLPESDHALSTASSGRVGFGGPAVIGTERVNGQLRRVFGATVQGSNADGSRPFRIAVDTSGKVRTLYGDGSKKQQRYQEAIDRHPKEVAGIAREVTEWRNASKAQAEATEALRKSTGEYYG